MSTSAEQIQIPDGFRLHTENTSHILLSANEAFLNPVQEFNRDLSIACIRTWSEDLNKAKEEKWKAALEKKAARKRLKSMLHVNTFPCIYWPPSYPDHDGKPVATTVVKEGDQAEVDEASVRQSMDDKPVHEVRHCFGLISLMLLNCTVEERFSTT